MGQATCCWCGVGLRKARVQQLAAWLCPTPACQARQLSRALYVPPGESDGPEVRGQYEVVCRYVPLPSQVLFEECAAKNILWGGQAGPGKSYGVRWWLYKRSLTVPGHTGLLLRENWDELNKTHLRAMEAEQHLIGAKFLKADRMMVFPNGSILDCGHMAEADAVSRYLSTEYGAIVPDEASRYPVDGEGNTPLAELSTRARKVYTDVEGREVRPRFLPVSNPGGPSAGWLRDMFIDHNPDLERFPALRGTYDETQWVYIPARLDDNPYQDPEYARTLAVLSGWRYQQLREGDWHVFAGQFFHEWRESLHVRVVVADGVEWFASMDWGYNAPGCVLWWACLPDGHYHIAREYKFQGQSAEAVAEAIRTINRELGIRRLRYVACDPAMKSKTGAGRGESILETLQRARLPMVPSDNDRYNGWLRCHELLRTAPDGTPWVTIDPGCRYLIRSLPAQMSDRKDPDDIDTTGDDHGADAFRYGAMSRPSPTRKVSKVEWPKGSAGALMREVIAANARQRYVH